MDAIEEPMDNIFYNKNSFLKAFLSNENKKMKSRTFNNPYSKQNGLNHANSLTFTEISNISTNYQLEANTPSVNRIASIMNKKRRKVVTFKPNYNLVEKIFFDPNEPVVASDEKEEYIIPDDIDKNETIDELRKIQNKENEEDKINTNCTCLIF